MLDLNYVLSESVKSWIGEIELCVERECWKVDRWNWMPIVSSFPWLNTHIKSRKYSVLFDDDAVIKAKCCHFTIFHSMVYTIFTIFSNSKIWTFQQYRSEYHFIFNDKFEIHDDIEVLKRMGLLLGKFVVK